MIFCALCVLDKYLNNLKSDVNTNNSARSSDDVPRRQLGSTSWTAPARPVDDPFAIGTLHWPENYLNFTLVHKGQ